MREAVDNLTQEDWDVVAFYRNVRDQVVNQAPLGTKDGKPYTTPRLEAWEAACRLYGVPREQRCDLIETARWLHEYVEDRGDSAMKSAAMTEDLAPEDF